MRGELENIWNARKWLEIAAWIALVTVLWGTDLLAKYLAGRQDGTLTDLFKLVSEQATSGLAVLIMVPFLVHWLKLFPPALKEWPRMVIGHSIGSVFFAFGHFALMVALRIPWYALNGRSYVWREPFVNNLIVEYQKDIKIYIGFAVLISVYQYYRRVRSAALQTQTDRLVVQSGTANRVLRLEDIEYLESARNYVAIHAEGREYIVRDTMTNLSHRLSAGPFQRTHRSFIVNIDKIAEIGMGDTGARIILTSGKEVPLSRSYRDELSRRVGG